MKLINKSFEYARKKTRAGRAKDARLSIQPLDRSAIIGAP